MHGGREKSANCWAWHHNSSHFFSVYVISTHKGHKDWTRDHVCHVVDMTSPMKVCWMILWILFILVSSEIFFSPPTSHYIYSSAIKRFSTPSYIIPFSRRCSFHMLYGIMALCILNNFTNT